MQAPCSPYLVELVTIATVPAESVEASFASAIRLLSSGPRLLELTAAFALVLLTVGTDTLALDLLAGVTTPWAGVHWFATDFTAVAGLLGPTACAAAATRVVDLGSSTA